MISTRKHQIQSYIQARLTLDESIKSFLIFLNSFNSQFVSEQSFKECLISRKTDNKKLHICPLNSRL